MTVNYFCFAYARIAFQLRWNKHLKVYNFEIKTIRTKLIFYAYFLLIFYFNN